MHFPCHRKRFILGRFPLKKKNKQKQTDPLCFTVRITHQGLKNAEMLAGMGPLKHDKAEILFWGDSR
jgi:hypothetical protein